MPRSTAKKKKKKLLGKNLSTNHVNPNRKTRIHLVILRSYRTLVDNMLRTVKTLVKAQMALFKIVSITKCQHWKVPLKPGGS